MSPERWRLVEHFYHSAHDIAPAGREAWLEMECQGDQDLYSEVISLLSAEPADDWIARPPFSLAAEIVACEQPHVAPGCAIAQYVIQKITITTTTTRTT